MSKALLARICKVYRKVNSISINGFKIILSTTLQVEGYTGPAMTVAEDDLGTLKEIFFMPNGKLDWPNLLAHTGANSGFVKLLHDQLGFSDASQTDTTKMPKIVDSGVLITENGEAAIKFDGVNDYFTFSNPISASQSVVSFIAVATRITTGSNSWLLGSNSASKTIDYVFDTLDRPLFRAFRSVNKTNVGTAVAANETLIFGAVTDRSIINSYQNGVLDKTTADSNTDFTIPTNMFIGATGVGPAGFFSGTLQFFGISLNDESDNMLEIYNNLAIINGINGEADQTFNVATSTYVTGTTGDLPNTVFSGDILKSISLEKELGFYIHGNESKTTVSSLYLANEAQADGTGKFDSLLTPNLINTLISFSIIEEGAAYSTAVQIGEFVVEDVTNPENDQIKIDLIDKISALDKNTVHEHFPNTITFENNRDQPEPWNIGYVNQFAMPMVDDVNNIYEMTQESAVNSITDVKDRADPLIITTDWVEVAVTDTGGRGIDLNSPSDGTITASFIGKNYNTKVTNTFEGFVGKLLVDIAQIPASDIDFTTAAAIDVDLVYKYGISIPQGTNIKDILDNLVASHCGFYYQKNDGTIAFGVLSAPTTTSVFDVTSIDLEDGVFLESDQAPNLSDGVAAKKNWHVFSYDEVRDIGGLSKEDKQTVSSDFAEYARSTITAAGGRVFAGPYAHARNGDYIESLLTDLSSAYGLLGQYEAIYSEARSFYTFGYLSDDIINNLTLELNDVFNLTYGRYGLENGKYLRIMAIKFDDVLKGKMKIRGWG